MTAMTTTAFALAYAGWAALSLAMGRHYRQIAGRAPARSLAIGLRLTGFAPLALSLMACVATSGWGVGIVAWFGVLSATGLAWIGLLAATPRLALLTVPGVVLIALAASV